MSTPLIVVALLLVTPVKAPDLAFDPTGRFSDEPQVAAPAVRKAATAGDEQRVRELLARQDRCILDHRADLAKQDFDESYSSADLHCDSGEELLDRWDDYVHMHQEAALASDLLHAERVGDWIVADVRRCFTGVRLEDQGAVRDESFETHVLHDVAGKLRISATYDNEAKNAARIDRKGRIYDARDELLYQVSLPEPFVPLPRRGPGAALDELMLLDPADEATLGLMVYDPTIDEPLEHLLWRDCAEPDAKWRLEPRRLERLPLVFQEGIEAEVDCPGRPGKGARCGPATERIVYLSPDGRIVFAFWLRCAPANFERLKPRFDQFVRSLKLGDHKRPSFHAALLHANPRWNTLDGNIFRAAAATDQGPMPVELPVELIVPPLFAATPLLGDHVVRLRLRILEDPKSSIIVRFFPSGEDRIAAGALLDRSVRRMEAFACAEGKGGDSHRSDGTMDVLGRHGDWHEVEVACSDGSAGGSRRSFQIVAVDVDDCHVQVQVLPGSDRIELQSHALKQVLDGLRVRAPGTAGTAVESATGVARPDGQKPDDK